MSARHARPTRAQARAGGVALQPQPEQARTDRVRVPARPYRRGCVASPPPTRRWVRAAQQMLAATAAVTAAGIIGVVGSSETFALWSGGAVIEAGSLTSGNADLVVLGGTLSPFENALPGEQRTYAFSIDNTGTVPLDVTMRIATSYAGFDLHARIYLTAVNCSELGTADLIPIGETPTAQATPIHHDDSLQVCAIVTANSAVTPGAEAPFELIFDGEQAP